MQIGTIGAGAFARAFAKQALKAGHQIKLSNSRGPASLRQIVEQLGPGATAASKEETTPARSSKLQPYSPVTAIQSSILATSAMAG
jgi:predicted dinucleotide-binding enzyme